MIPVRRIASTACLAVLLIGCTSTEQRPPATWGGLELRETGESGNLYVRPGAASKADRTVVIDPLVITTDKNWFPARDITTGVIIGTHIVSGDEIKYLERTIGSEFRSIFVAELEAGGYRVVDRPGAGTVRVSAALMDVYVNTTERSLDKDPYAGSMTLLMDVSDASTGQSFARLVDQERGRFGTLELPNTVTTNDDWRAAVQAWARRLRTILDGLAPAK